jgi:hypothetical protein
MKLNNIIFLLSAVLMVIACSDKKETNHAKIIWDKYDNGNYKTVHQYFTDTADISGDYYYQEFYENGSLKTQGLENQKVRKGEWKIYFDNGDIRAKLTFDNNILNGPIELYNQSGAIKATGIAENGRLKSNNEEINKFLVENFNISESRANWNDSLDVIVDSLNTILN